MKKRNWKKKLVVISMSMGLMLCSLGMTASAAYATLSKSYSSGKGTVVLCNTSQVYRFGEVYIEQHNAGESGQSLGRNWGRLESGERVSLTKTITKEYAIGIGYLHNTSSLDSSIIFSKEVVIK